MSHVETKKHGGILEIRINRPEKYNALSVEMYHDIGRAYAELNRDSELRVALLYAEGKHFTAGIELDKWAPIFGAGKGFPVKGDEIDPFGINGERHRKPVVIAVQGYCYTWGVEIMLNCEVRIAASDTKFAMLEVKRGIYPCGGATMRLPEQAGWSNGMRYLLTGDTWTAEQSLQWGLVQEVVEPGQQYAKARDVAQRIASAAPLGVQAVLKSSRLARLEGERAAAAILFDDLAPILKSDDAREGVQSFLERRDARFTGK
jgi:enoyl-CoA hydratase